MRIDGFFNRWNSSTGIFKKGEKYAMGKFETDSCRFIY